jgi:DNA-binding transcriptional MocR family regulator
MPTMPIKALDGDDRVIYIKSFSKIFMPGLRLGAVIAPAALREGMLSSKQTTDISSSSLMQRAFDLYLRKKKWHSHILYMQEAYNERYEAMKEALSTEFPEAEYMDPKGGIHMWVKTPADSSVLGAAARMKGVVIAPGSIFYVDERKSNYFRLSFAAEDKQSIKRGIQLLKEAYLQVKS